MTVPVRVAQYVRDLVKTVQYSLFSRDGKKGTKKTVRAKAILQGLRELVTRVHIPAPTVWEGMHGCPRICNPTTVGSAATGRSLEFSGCHLCFSISERPLHQGNKTESVGAECLMSSSGLCVCKPAHPSTQH